MYKGECLIFPGRTSKMDRFQDFTCLYSSKTQLIKKNRNHRVKYRIQTKALKSEGQKYGNGEFGKFSIEI